MRRIQNSYSPTQFAKKLGVTIKSLEDYQKLGIITPTVSSKGKYVYTDKNYLQ